MNRNKRIEIAANALNTLSILLAGSNSVHTWWTGIAGCLLFGAVFFSVKLYADATLQGFFVVTSVIGWWSWLHGHRGDQLPVRRTRPQVVVWLCVTGSAVFLLCLLRLFVPKNIPCRRC